MKHNKWEKEFFKLSKFLELGPGEETYLWEGVKSLLHQERKRVIEECETLINYSEGRASGLECSQAGYEYGVEDVLSIFKKRSKE